MIRTITVEQVTLATDRSFADVVTAFEATVGTMDASGLESILSVTAEEGDLEQRAAPLLGSSGFTRFLTIDHGRWLTKLGHPSQFVMYTIGNPVIAITMLEHDIEAGLDVPLRLAIFAHASGKTHFVYNKPSTLMSGLDNEALHAAAQKLDAKLLALAETVTGAKA